jgi:hypothetical protein
MRLLTLYFACVAGLFLSSCSRPGKTDKEGMYAYLNKPSHGLQHEEEKNGIKAKIRYQPQELLVMQEWEHAEKQDSSLLDSLRRKYNAYRYFVLELSKDNKEVIRELGSFGRYSDMLQVMAFQMQQYVNITTAARDTVTLSDYVFQQTYGMSNANSLLFVFPAAELQKAGAYDINVGEFGLGIGNLHFHFREEDIKEVPELDFANNAGNR